MKKKTTEAPFPGKKPALEMTRYYRLGLRLSEGQEAFRLSWPF